MKTAETKISPAVANLQRGSKEPFFGRQWDAGFHSAINETGPFFSKTPSIQAKLTIGRPNDKYEQEADAVADKVVQKLSEPKTIQRKQDSSINHFIQPKCAECEKEELQKKEEENAGENTSELQRQAESAALPDPPSSPDDNNFNSISNSVQLKCNNCEFESLKPAIQAKPIFESDAEEPVQRKCEACEKEEKVQKKEGPGSEAVVSPSIESRLSSASGSGTALPDRVRNSMESSVGVDFSNVKIHTDSNAVQMSKDLKAQAFTLGSDIYFNNGKYNPENKDGQHLLAHELTHVVQQNANNKKVQRLPDDKHDLTATLLSGDPILEKTFDNEAVIGKFSNSKGEHVERIQKALIQLGIELPQFGADGKYGTETENAVKDFQQKAGMSKKEWDGIIGRKTLGLLDRSVRNNSISTDTDKAENDLLVTDPKKQAEDEACKGKATDKPCPDPNDSVVNAAGEAIKMIDKVLDNQLPPVKNKLADYPDIFNRIFRNNDTRDISFTVDEVKKNYIQVKTFLGNLQKDKSLARCGTECDGGCRSGSPAYHTNTSGKHIITFCPDFDKDKQKILIVLHESHHAAIPGSSDKAYNETRLFDKLDHNKALLNAASFHVYAALVDKPGSESIGPDIKDSNLVSDKTQKDNVNMALAFMNQWFRLITFDISETIQGVQEAKVKGKYTKHNPEVFMELVFSNWFEATKPPLVPNELDIKKLKAIEERVNKMDKAFKSPFVIIETPNQSFWTDGPGTDIALNKNVLSLDIAHMDIALLQELVHATPNISAESEPLYVGTINDMRNLRQLDP